MTEWPHIDPQPCPRCAAPVPINVWDRERLYPALRVAPARCPACHAVWTIPEIQRLETTPAPETV